MGLKGFDVADEGNPIVQAALICLKMSRIQSQTIMHLLWLPNKRLAVN